MDEAKKIFSLSDVNKSPARFDKSKLEHINKHYISNTDDVKLFDLLTDAFRQKLGEEQKRRLMDCLPLIKSRGGTLNELRDLAYLFIEEKVRMDEKAKEFLNDEAIKLLSELMTSLEKIDPWNAENIEKVCKQYIESKSIKPALLMKTLRAATLGTFNSPPLYHSLEVMTKETAISRIKRVLDI